MKFENIKKVEFSNIKERSSTWFDKIYWDFFYVIYAFFSNCFYKLKKIYQYSVYLWKMDEDFDYIYIIQLLDFKLNRMKKVLNSSPWSSNDDAIDQIEHVQKLINDYLEKTFIEEELKELDKVYKQIERFEPIEGQTSLLWLMDYEENGVLHKDGSKRAEEISQLYRDLHALGRTRKEECKNEIFRYLADNIENWWD